MPSPQANPQAVREHYARLAPIYDRRWDRYTRRTLAAALRHLDLDRPQRILDVACGTGRLEEMILQAHSRDAAEVRPDEGAKGRRGGASEHSEPGTPTARTHILGIDLSPDMIRIARERIPESEDIRWLVASAEELPAQDESFDTVVCANAFHLIPQPETALAEFHRVLRPGGRLIIVDWCREYPTVMALLIVARIFDKQYRRVMTVAGLSRDIERAGFRVSHAERFKATWFWGLMCIAAHKPPAA